MNIDSVTDFNETAIKQAYCWSSPEAVRILLSAGADDKSLGWSALHKAVYFGDIAQVESQIAHNANIESRDAVGCTPLLTACRTGRADVAKLLLDAGAEITAESFMLGNAAYLATKSGNVECLDIVVRAGADVGEYRRHFGDNLSQAVEDNDFEMVRALLAKGSDPNATDGYDAVIDHCQSLEMFKLLLSSGADGSQIDGETQRRILGLEGLGEEVFGIVSQEDFARAKTPRFGRSNPELVNEPFVDAMIRSGMTAFAARQRFSLDPVFAPGWPSRDSAIFCARRFGQSLTVLNDGRLIQIGGEHEDGYDPDFCIYNDVFVHEPDGTIKVYFYPEADFPTTDNHTSTLVGDAIYIIGNLGYPKQRTPGFTPVYRLNLDDMSISEVLTSGHQPSWIYGHSASLNGNNILVFGGKVCTTVGKKNG